MFQTKAEQTEIDQIPTLPDPIQVLEEISWNYWWCWAPDGAAVYRDLDPEVWEECEHNPRRLLKETSELRLTQMSTDPVYLSRVERLHKGYLKYMSSDRITWARRESSIKPERPVAYFCAEYGIHTSLPLYSGGLGILAGDHLKSASDLDLPLVGIGLMYRYGYFRQRLNHESWQEEHYLESSPQDLPLKLVVDNEGKPVIVEVEMRGRVVQSRVWRVEVGRVSLYLLDTNIETNEEVDRWITSHLYGGDRETRVVQEMLLGIGGVRLLRKLRIDPHVYHLNEGHSAFLTLELAREMIAAQGLDYSSTIEPVRKRCVFTTHTPIAAGNDVFDFSLLQKCFGEEYVKSLKLTSEEFLGLGQVHAGENNLFGLTPLAIKMCRSTNGVSLKHGEVSRVLWKGLWPEKRLEEIPIGHITNGVHPATWIAPLLRGLYEKKIGVDWEDLLHDPKAWASKVKELPARELWEIHTLLKSRLISLIRHRTYYARIQSTLNVEHAEAAKTMFDPKALTIGFARRVAGYKRWTLILSNKERLMRLLNDEKRPVQFVFAGKAHPQDSDAKLALQSFAQWKNDPTVMQRAVFLQDYDQEIARIMVHGVDVWLNLPRRPLEASGTSGQKVVLNGGLNFSILDGWWIEGYDGSNGWAIGDVLAGDDPAVEDQRDAESLYTLLEKEIVPLYYNLNSEGIPQGWIEMMKRSIETLSPAFSSDRMVQEYVNKIYK
jgi:glycogen phosphorylase